MNFLATVVGESQDANKLEQIASPHGSTTVGAPNERKWRVKITMITTIFTTILAVMMTMMIRILLPLLLL